MRFPRVWTLAFVALLVAFLAAGVVVAIPVETAAVATAADGDGHGPIDHLDGGTGDDTETEAETTDDTDEQTSSLEPADPAQVVHVNVTDAGDAIWTIETRFLLENDSDEEAFTGFADAVATGERDAGHSPAMYEEFREQAEMATDREMAITDAGYADPRVETEEREVEDSTETVGTIAYTFTWEGFAETEGSRIFVGDAFESPDGGTWFPELGSDQRLAIQIPENYAF